MAINVKFLKGTAAAYAALTKDANTFYYTDDNNLYLGEIKLSNAADLALAVADIATNAADIDKLQTDLSALVGDGEGAGSVSDMIADAVDVLRQELTPKITEAKDAADAAQAKADANETAINTEKARAEAAEKVNADAIAALTTKVDDNETDIEAKMTAVTNRVAANETAIADRYTKSEADTKIAEAVAASKHLKKEIVETLPAVEDAAEDVIYMVAVDGGEGVQKYEEYMLINGAMEKIGDTAVDLTGYAKETYVDQAEADAIAAAKAYADEKDTAMDARVDAVEAKLAEGGAVETAIATAKSEAIADAAADATTKDAQVLTDAKAYADGLADNYETAGAAEQALTDAKAYVDGKLCMEATIKALMVDPE